MEPITSFLKTGKLARKQSYRNLTIFPLLGPDGGTRPNYLTLEQALDDNLIQITEKDLARKPADPQTAGRVTGNDIARGRARRN